jgi:putative transposase
LYNSAAESFFGSFKTERIFDTTDTTSDEARRDIVDKIEMFYNSKNRHSYLGYLSPDQFENLIVLKKTT